MKNKTFAYIKKAILNRYFVQVVLTVIPTVLLIFIPMQLSFLDPVTRAFNNFNLTDLYQQFMRNESLRQSNEIYILDIANVKERDHIAHIIKDLDDVNPKVIGLDILFEQRSGALSEEDIILQKTIGRLKNTLIVGYYFTPENNLKQSFFISPESSLKYSGYVNSTVENKYIECLRTFAPRMKVGSTVYDSFALRVVQQYNPEKECSPTGEFITNYTNASFSIIQPEDISPLLSGKIVLIGSASGYEDLFLTPVGDLRGVEIHAYNIHNMLHNNYIIDVHWLVDMLISMLIGGFAIWFCNFSEKKFKKTSNFIFNSFLWLYLIVLTFINICVCHFFRMSIPFTLAFISFVFISTACELQNALYNRKKNI